MLVAATVAFTLVLAAALSSRASLALAYANESGFYSKVQMVELFERLASSGPAYSNTVAYGEWLNSLQISAQIDGLSVTAANSTLIISTRAEPIVYAIIESNGSQ